MNNGTLGLLSIGLAAGIFSSVQAATIADCSAIDCGGFSNVSLGVNADFDAGALSGGGWSSAAALGGSTGAASAESFASRGALQARLTTSVTTGTATATTQASFADTIEIASGTLAIGTPVQVELQVWVHGTRVLGSGIGGGNGTVDAIVQGFHLNASGFQIGQLPNVAFNDNSSFSSLQDFNRANTLRSAVIDAAVGDRFQLFTQFQLSAATNAGGSADMNFFDTAHIGLLALNGADLNLLGKTGVDYEVAPVPLPAALGLLASALGGVLTLRMRPRRSSNAA